MNNNSLIGFILMLIATLLAIVFILYDKPAENSSSICDYEPESAACEEYRNNMADAEAEYYNDQYRF